MEAVNQREMDFQPTGRMVLGSTIWLMRANFFASDWRVSTFIIWRSVRESFTTQVVSYIAIDLSILIRYKKERLIVRFWDDFRNLFCHRLIPISLPSWEENAPRTLPVNN